MTSSAAQMPCARFVAEEAAYELVVTPPARRALAQELPESVVAAVIEFVTSSLLERPRVVGKRLRAQLTGIWSARRGTYRILYRVIDSTHEIVVLRIGHRRHAYR